MFFMSLPEWLGKDERLADWFARVLFSREHTAPSPSSQPSPKGRWGRRGAGYRRRSGRLPEWGIFSRILLGWAGIMEATLLGIWREIDSRKNAKF
jgi:hypothetical protein